MDRTISRLPSATSQEPLGRALSEVDAAIALIVAGVALTVTLCSLEAAEEAAFIGAMSAQAAGVAFRLRRDRPGSVSLVIGPRVPRPLMSVAPEVGA
jgi:hypothetical protein